MTCSGGEDGEGPPYTRMGEDLDQAPTSLTHSRVGEETSAYHKMRMEDGPVYHQMREEMTRSPVYQKTRPPSQALILTTGILSVLLSLGVLLPSVLLLVNTSYWHNLHSALEGWLERHPWDRKVDTIIITSIISIPVITIMMARGIPGDRKVSYQLSSQCKGLKSSVKCLCWFVLPFESFSSM